MRSTKKSAGCAGGDAAGLICWLSRGLVLLAGTAAGVAGEALFCICRGGRSMLMGSKPRREYR